MDYETAFDRVYWKKWVNILRRMRVNWRDIEDYNRKSVCPTWDKRSESK